jgi:hypothetical protein
MGAVHCSQIACPAELVAMRLENTVLHFMGISGSAGKYEVMTSTVMAEFQLTLKCCETDWYPRDTSACPALTTPLHITYLAHMYFPLPTTWHLYP